MWPHFRSPGSRLPTSVAWWPAGHVSVPSLRQGIFSVTWATRLTQPKMSSRIFDSDLYLPETPDGELYLRETLDTTINYLTLLSFLMAQLLELNISPFLFNCTSAAER